MGGIYARALRLLVLTAAAIVGVVLLEPYGLSWVVLPVGVVATLGIAVHRWRRRRVGSEEARWAGAVLSPTARPGAIAELKAARQALGPVTDATRSRWVRLTVLLGELLDADERTDEARELLDAIEVAELGALDAGIVRHARAVVCLRGGDADGARRAVAGRPPSCGSRDVDLRLDLIEASADLELGDAEKALETATRVRRAAGGDEALVVEARVVRAAALDALGERSDALTVLRSLGGEMLSMLQVLGQPRVRDLAAEASKG